MLAENRVMSRPSHRCCSCLYRLIGYTGVMVTCFLGETLEQ